MLHVLGLLVSEILCLVIVSVVDLLIYQERYENITKWSISLMGLNPNIRDF